MKGLNLNSDHGCRFLHWFIEEECIWGVNLIWCFQHRRNKRFEIDKNLQESARLPFYLIIFSSTPLFDRCVPIVTTWYKFKLVFVFWARFDDRYILTNNNLTTEDCVQTQPINHRPRLLVGVDASNRKRGPKSASAWDPMPPGASPAGTVSPDRKVISSSCSQPVTVELDVSLCRVQGKQSNLLISRCTVRVLNITLGKDLKSASAI